MSHESQSHRVGILEFGVPLTAALGEADNPDGVDYYTLNKEQPLHLDIDADPDQIELDSEEFQDEVEDEMTHEENIMLEEEEKLKATVSPLSKVCIPHVKFSYFSMLMFMLAMLHQKQNCLITPAMEVRNAQSQYITRKTQSTRTGKRP